MNSITRSLKLFFKVLFTIIAFIFQPRILVFVFQLFAVIALLIFVFAYYYAFQTFRQLHKEYQIGHLQSSECGFEYMVKESGINHIYEALTNPEHPLQNRVQRSLNYTLYVIALLSVAVFCLTMYYLTNDADKPSFRRDALNIGWITITKMGLYLRYILLPSILAVGFLVYYNSKRELYIPDFKEALKQYDETDTSGTNVEDPAFAKKKTKELDRGIDETISRQWITPGLMIVVMIVMLKFYVPDIPISKALLSAVFLVIVLSALIMTQFTRFFGGLQLIFHTKYMKPVIGLNESASQMLEVPEFRSYLVNNAKRLEKYSEEPFQDNQVERLKSELKLHHYLQHHATRSDELAFMTAVERGKTRSNKTLTWSPVVNRIRSEMNTLREADTAVQELFKKTSRQMLFTFLVPVFIGIYIGFHLMYRSNPGSTIVMVVVLLLIAFVFVFLKNMSSLVRPKDPEPELYMGKK